MISDMLLGAICAAAGYLFGAVSRARWFWRRTLLTAQPDDGLDGIGLSTDESAG